MVQTEPVEETVDDGGDTDSETPEDEWESQWNDFGTLPKFMPKFNVALANFIVQQAHTKTSFPEMLHQEGGSDSFKQFIMIFDSPYPKILQILGGRVSTYHRKEIVKCIALAKFLNLPEYNILGTDDSLPEYSDFKRGESL
jgi:hypothetical protein